MLAPHLYVILLAGSSLMTAWGTAGQYTMLSELGGPERRMASNSLASAQVSFATIVGPLLAGLLLGWVSPGLLLALDAASFAFLGIAAWSAGAAKEAVGQPIDARAESGFRLLRRPDLLSLTLVTWVFFFLYGHNMRRITLLIVAGWGACLLPFAFAPIPVTLAVFAIGGLIYGPFIPLTYALFQSSTTAVNLPSVASGTLAAAGLATVLLAAVASVLWTGERADAPSSTT